MNKSISLILLMISTHFCFAVDDKYFYENGEIVDGDIYGKVYVNNDDTTVNMTGGYIENLYLSDDSSFNMFGGSVVGFTIDANFTSYFSISGGLIDTLDFVLYGAGGNISGGNISAYRLKTSSHSLVLIEGGLLTIDVFDIYGDMEIKGGIINCDMYFAQMNSTMIIYSEEYFYNAAQKILVCNLTNGGYLKMGYVEQQEYDSINFIPEPSTVLLFSTGMLVIKQKRFKNRRTL